MWIIPIKWLPLSKALTTRNVEYRQKADCDDDIQWDELFFLRVYQLIDASAYLQLLPDPHVFPWGFAWL